MITNGYGDLVGRLADDLDGLDQGQDEHPVIVEIGALAALRE
ncbi:MAG: hypothetical protein ABIF71_02060 [Planctomycetota bacterium]